MASSIQVSPSNEFILTSYRMRFGFDLFLNFRSVENEESFESIYFHIYRQFDWRLCVSLVLLILYLVRSDWEK